MHRKQIRISLSIAKAGCYKTYLDFITVDGGEGGTGATPQNIQTTLECRARHRSSTTPYWFCNQRSIKIIASGKVITGFDIIEIYLFLGADLAQFQHVE
jgi:glutamate synthase domain-containing protein 2